MHVVVVTGGRPPPPQAGQKQKPEFFCAGADIGMLQGADPYFKYSHAL